MRNLLKEKQTLKKHYFVIKQQLVVQIDLKLCDVDFNLSNSCFNIAS